MSQITSEELEALNRATEILSKYANRGGITPADFEHFEKMVVAIIDGEEDTDSLSESQQSVSSRIYPTSKYRIDDSLFAREVKDEERYGIQDLKLYGYFSDTESLDIVGEIIAKKPKKPFCMICTLYDKDGDIIETEECVSYGSGLVTSMIYPNAFFNGFPFKFSFWGVSKRKVKKICIAPADGY